MRIVIAISRASTVAVTYTTVHIAFEALRRGHQVRFVEPWDYEVDVRGRLIARAFAFDEPVEHREALVNQLNERRAARRYVELSQVDAMLMRVNPMNPAVLAFAQLVQRYGVPVFNDPTTLQLTGHKAYLATLHDVPTPCTLVTRSRAMALLCAAEYRQGVVVKPARSSGGRGVSLVRRSRDADAVEDAFEYARLHGDGYVVLQEYLPQAADGEKRLVWLDGELIGGYLRSRAPGEFRHNLTRGGEPRACPLDDQDQLIARRLSPHLERDGVWLAGLDVIGGKVVEINTLNPGGVHYGDQLNGTSMGRRIVERLERLGSSK